MAMTEWDYDEFLDRLREELPGFEVYRPDAYLDKPNRCNFVGIYLQDGGLKDRLCIEINDMSVVEIVDEVKSTYWPLILTAFNNLKRRHINILEQIADQDEQIDQLETERNVNHRAYRNRIAALKDEITRLQISSLKSDDPFGISDL